jgi:threonine dehydratase
LISERSEQEPVAFADIQHAAEVLDGIAHRTPLITSRQLNAIAGATVYLKCENFQRVGAFKFRGAYHAVSTIHARQASAAIVTLSSGNHAQGIALACRLLDLAAHVVMIKPVNPLKYQAVLDYGAATYEVSDRDKAETVLQALVETHQGLYVHAFNDPLVIAGQGTAMLEFISDVPDLDAVLAPIGGGGLLSGASIVAHGLRPGMQIYACEPAGALDAVYSVRENRIVPMSAPNTIAEGLLTSVGDVTLPILRRHLSDFFVVEEAEIINAMRFAFERLKIVVEPAGAVALAPLLRREARLAGKKVGVIITGGNADLSRFFDR